MIPITARRGRPYAKANRIVAQSEGQLRRTVHYSGRVQGVGFRYTARRAAGRFAVTGYVQNLADGRVKLIAEGLPAELDGFLSAVRADLHENIDHEHVETATATSEFEDFDIRF